jgi:Transposase DDE domain
MLSANVKIIKELKNYIDNISSDPNSLDQYRKTKADFSRNRKLSFITLIIFICRLGKKTLSVELEQFFAEPGQFHCCTASALCQGRSKLCGTFFHHWSSVLCDCFYRFYKKKAKRWKGFRLVAADGSTLPFVDTPELREHFGAGGNQLTSYVLGRSFYHYDVLNQLILHADLKPYAYSEIKSASELICHLKPDMLMLYDRGFYSYRMIALHTWQNPEVKFVIRANENHSQVIRFIAGKRSSEVVDMAPGTKAIKQMRELGYQVTDKTTVKLRLVRIELDNKIEVIATNLWEEEGYEADLFKELYAMRWAIETNIGFQKNLLQLESFSGRKVHTVLQDFYATIFVANLHSLLIKEGQQLLDEQKHNGKYARKINNNRAQGEIRRNMTALFFSKRLVPVLKRLTAYVIKYPICKITGRKVDRIAKNKHRNKHRTFTNYKAAY